MLEAGLALTPGPFVAAAVAVPTSRLAERFGPRPVLVAGGLVWGAAVVWLVTRVGTTPDFLGEWLPAIVLLGVGAGIAASQPDRRSRGGGARDGASPRRRG